MPTYEDLTKTTQTYDSVLHRKIFFLKSTTAEEREALLKAALTEINDQYYNKESPNYTTPKTEKWYKKFDDQWKSEGSATSTEEVEQEDLSEISFNAELEGIPASFYDPSKKVIVVGPFWLSSLEVLY